MVPYAIYRAEGYVSAPLAERTGFSEEDLSLLWEALINMFDHDHSAASKMASRRLYAFEHESRIAMPLPISCLTALQLPGEISRLRHASSATTKSG